MASEAGVPAAAAVRLYWLPLGAGQRCVRWSGASFERLVAASQRRPRCDLFHTALGVAVDGARSVIEMAPVWGNPAPERGVVCEGPVGATWLGRSRAFRYEVRRWRDGVIPDAAAAVDGPRELDTDRARAQRLLELVPSFPPATWGRDELRTGEMWNSNSLIAWLLVRSGHDVDALAPPAGGRAPGWSAGIVVAQRAADPAWS